MRCALRPSCALFLVALAGCGQPVREDRALSFTPGGDSGAFQHGNRGVFIVEGEGQEPRKVFQPATDVIAVSSPIWAPSDRRLLFTTARREGKAAGPKANHDPDPAGQLHFEGPVVYTCWLRAAPRDGKAAEPVALFEAPCGHPGYVAANLAVRWSADGKQVLHVRRGDDLRHHLLAFDLESKALTSACPHSGEALVFDWSPEHRYLACVTANRAGPAAIYLQAAAGDWWQVPGTEGHVTSGTGSPLAFVREMLPVWAPAGDRCLVRLPLTPGDRPGGAPATVLLVDAAQRSSEVLVEDKTVLTDLHWRPDGNAVGAVQGDARTLVTIDPKTKKSQPLGTQGVVAFAGWDDAGKRLAHVLPQPIAGARDTWAFLYVPDRAARQAVYVQTIDATGPGKRLLGGMQTTFLRWSPCGTKLSLWATFRPPWRSWLSLLLELGATPDDPLAGLRLRPGDPAVLLDPATGKLAWQPTSPDEKDQVGHYHLLHRNYAEAWRWYTEADRERPAGPVQPTRDVRFFHHVCLSRLGRTEPADRARRDFEDNFLASIKVQRDARPANQPAAAPGTLVPAPTDAMLRHLLDLYEAEVFLALDAAADAEVFFREALRGAGAEADRLSKSVVLSQFLLLAGKHREYADLAADTILPLLLRTWGPARSATIPHDWANAVLAYGDGLALLPLADADFVSGLEVRQVRSLLARLEKLQVLADDDPKRLVVDLLLAAAYRRLEDGPAAKQAEGRIAHNPASPALLGNDGVPGLIHSLRSAPEMIEQLRQLAAAFR